MRRLFGLPEAGGRPARERRTLGEQEARAIADFSRHYGITFRRPDLLKLALTHRSYLSVTGQGPRESNERLEFLGDSVLGLVTSEYLYLENPNEHEGHLTKVKSLLVSKAILSRRALAMGLGRFVLMSHSEVESGGRQRLSILADAFESVVGAIYLDQGFEAARAFITRWLLADADAITADKRHTNYKSHLQEYVQSTFRTHPVYRIRSEVGPDHSKQFSVEVTVGRRLLGSGKGRNKKEAEQAAARDALEHVEAPTLRAERARQARARAPRPAYGEAVEEEAGEGAGEGAERARRRGRRAGRGRRPRAGAEAAEAPTDEAVRVPAVAEPAAGAVRGPAEEPGEAPAGPVEPPRRARTASAEAPEGVPQAVAPELEPEPRRAEEDENEEVGRPEGPREDLMVDPYDAIAERAPAEGTKAGGGRLVRVGSSFASHAPPAEDVTPRRERRRERHGRGRGVRPEGMDLAPESEAVEAPAEAPPDGLGVPDDRGLPEEGSVSGVPHAPAPSLEEESAGPSEPNAAEPDEQEPQEPAHDTGPEEPPRPAQAWGRRARRSR